MGPSSTLLPSTLPSLLYSPLLYPSPTSSPLPFSVLSPLEALQHDLIARTTSHILPHTRRYTSTNEDANTCVG